MHCVPYIRFCYLYLVVFPTTGCPTCTCTCGCFRPALCVLQPVVLLLPGVPYNRLSYLYLYLYLGVFQTCAVCPTTGCPTCTCTCTFTLWCFRPALRAGAAARVARQSGRAALRPARLAVLPVPVPEYLGVFQTCAVCHTTGCLTCTCTCTCTCVPVGVSDNRLSYLYLYLWVF